MKILITDIHHANGGGHTTYILNLLQGLKRTCRLTLAAPPTGRLYNKARTLEGVCVVPGLYSSRPLSLIAQVIRLRRFLIQERFDVIHVNGAADHRHVMLACLGLLHKPVIVWTKHNTKRVCSVGNQLRARFGADVSIAVSDYVASQLACSSYGRKPIHIVRNGIDSNFFRPVDAAKKAVYRHDLLGELDDDVLVLGSTGGTDYEKGWLVLCQAIARLEPALQRRLRVVVAGDPPSVASLQQVQALGLHDKVVFPGMVCDVRSLLGACDIGFVLSFLEAASYACYEAMSMGLPTLVSDAGGLPENVRNGQDGWVVPAKNTEAVERLLRSVLADSACLSILGQSARQRVEQLFSIEEFLADTTNIYRQAMVLAQGTAPSSAAIRKNIVG